MVDKLKQEEGRMKGEVDKRMQEEGGMSEVVVVVDMELEWECELNVYMKDMESISSFMALTGASAGVLELENIRILKDIRNNVNRQINCENANIDKTVRSALGQLADINAIIEGGGMLGG